MKTMLKLAISAAWGVLAATDAAKADYAGLFGFTMSGPNGEGKYLVEAMLNADGTNAVAAAQDDAKRKILEAVVASKEIGGGAAAFELEFEDGI